MRRIGVIDFLRGTSILFMLLFHGSYYWDSLPSKNQMNQMLSNPIAGLAMLLGKAAGIFALLSGMSNAVSMNSRMNSGKHKPKQIFFGGLITGLWILIIGKVQGTVFNHTIIGTAEFPYPDGPSSYAIIVGSIQTGSLQLPNMYSLFYRTTALFIIGLSVICTGIALALLGLKEGYKKTRRNLIILGVVATTIVMVTHPIKESLRPIWLDAYVNGKHAKGAFLSILIGDSFPFFPYVGYALYGAMFGIAFSQNIDKRKVTLVGGIGSGVYIVAGSILLGFMGHPSAEEIHETLSIQWNFLLVGFFLLISTFVYNVHYWKEERKARKFFTNTFTRRFGIMTLTIFVFEPLVGTSIKVLIMDNIFPGWSVNPVFPFIYGGSLIFLWYGILKLWEKGRFIGSLEWINGKITSFLTGRNASRINIVRNLYGKGAQLEKTSKGHR